MDGNTFITAVCKQLVRDLTANNDVLGLTSNSDLKGAFAEASIHQFLRRFVEPLRVSSGAIVYEGNCGNHVPQLDAIIWQPCPLPPILEAGTFAFIPRSTGLGFLEVKRSNYSGVGKAMKAHLDQEDELVPLIEGEGVWGNQIPRRAMGVICVYDEFNAKDSDLEALLAEHRTVALLRRASKTAEYVPDTDAILLLSRFLMGVRARAGLLDGKVYAKRPDPGTIDSGARASGWGPAGATSPPSGYRPHPS